jgi:hypothetical protein
MPVRISKRSAGGGILSFPGSFDRRLTQVKPEIENVVLEDYTNGE